MNLSLIDFLTEYGEAAEEAKRRHDEQEKRAKAQAATRAFHYRRRR